MLNDGRLPKKRAYDKEAVIKFFRMVCVASTAFSLNFPLFCFQPTHMLIFSADSEKILLLWATCSKSMVGTFTTELYPSV